VIRKCVIASAVWMWVVATEVMLLAVLWMRCACLMRWHGYQNADSMLRRTMLSQRDL
jgi:hypothetical protein